jgi:hypothetical protein
MRYPAVTYVLFALGAFLLVMHTTIPVLWRLAGVPFQYPLSATPFLQFSQGFTPMLGVLCMLAAGLIAEKAQAVR